MEKISVYGSSGFIGSRFCEMFPEDVIKIPREQRVPESNQILNLISTTDNYNVFEDPTKDIKTNLVIPMEILANARVKYNNDFTYTFISSWFVYGNTILPIKEDSYCNPKGIYAITKRCAEQLLISYCETFKINYRILRLGNVLGETDHGVSKKKNALQYLIKELANGHAINLYDGGYFKRDYMYVDDVASAIHLCIEKAPVNDIMHVALGEPTVFRDLIDYAKERLKSEGKINYVEPSDFHKVVQTKDNYLDITKLNALGFVPKYTVYDALDRVIDAYSSNSNI